MRFKFSAALGAAALFVIAAAPATAGAAARSSSTAHPSGVHMRDAGRPTKATLLVDHGGKILPASHTYVIWWGSSSSWSSDVESGIASLFGGFNGSGYLNTATQYLRGASASSTYEGAKQDTSAPPKSVSPSTLGTEVAKEYGTSLDPDGIYFVYTSNFPSGGNYCAWHSLASVNGQQISVAYMPNTTGVTGCDPGNNYSLSGSEGLRSLANVTAHEFMESVTDTLPASGTYGWIDNSGSEIGDKCAWQFGGAVKLSNNTSWQLQEEWSNAVDGCVETT